MHEDKLQLRADVQALHRTITRIGWTAAIGLMVAGIGVLGAYLF
jgi:hypothetical protein